MKICLFLAPLLFALSISAQTKKGYNRVYFSYSKQNYRDAKSIKYDGTSPDNHIFTPNTNAHCWSLGYERVTHSGLSLSAELQYGVRRYTISLTQNMTNFDPEASKNLNNLLYNFGEYGTKINYWGPKLMIGYRKQITHKWFATAKVGFAIKLFYSCDWTEFTGKDLEYDKDNGQSQYLSIAVMNLKFGRESPGRDKISFPVSLPTYECYIGLERLLNFRFLKNIAIGLEGSRGFYMWNRHEVVVIHSSPTINQIGASRDVFIDRNIAYGLHISLGMWK